LGFPIGTADDAFGAVLSALDSGDGRTNEPGPGV